MFPWTVLPLQLDRQLLEGRLWRGNVVWCSVSGKHSCLEPTPWDSDLTALGYGLSIRGVLKLSL